MEDEVERVLSNDTLRVSSMLDEEIISVTILTDGNMQEAVDVRLCDMVKDVVRDVLGVPGYWRDHKVRVLMGSQMVHTRTFEDNGIEDHATLGVEVLHAASFEEILNALNELNPVGPEFLENGVKYNADGSLKNWNLSRKGISELPENIGDLMISGNLNFGHNDLKSLPETIGNLSVGGNLSFSSNQIEKLPDSVAGMSVSGYLSFGLNALETLPDSIGGLCCGGNLSFHANRLTSLPGTVGDVSCGGNLSFDMNALETLPESIGNVHVGGHLDFDCNVLASLPQSLSRLEREGLTKVSWKNQQNPCA